MQFNACADATLGIEIEFQLLDPVTLDLADGILTLLHNYPQTPEIKPELTQCSVEINSKICTSIEELEANVISLVKTLKERCKSSGMTLCTAGSHPFCRHPVSVTPLPRYLAQEKKMPYLSHRLKTFALHVHVGMPSGDVALAVMTGLKPYLPILLALSASSPFWEGEDTNFASFRQRFLAMLRDYGMPPSFGTWNEFVEFFEMTQRVKTATISRDLHWDLRPSPSLGTLEVRVMDALPTIRENLMITALTYTLIVHLLRCRNQKTCAHLPAHHWWIEKMNHFNASYQGLDADYIFDDQGHSGPIKAVIREVLEKLTATAHELGTAKYLQHLKNHLINTPSYLRQRQLFQETGSLRTVVANLVKELEEDLAAY